MDLAVCCPRKAVAFNHSLTRCHTTTELELCNSRMKSWPDVINSQDAIKHDTNESTKHGMVHRADSRLAPNQWETSLQSNTISHQHSPESPFKASAQEATILYNEFEDYTLKITYETLAKFHFNFIIHWNTDVYWWLSAKLQYLQCWGTGDTAVWH